MKRRIGTCFLALAMLLAMLPASALAAEGGTGAAADSWENCTSCSPDNPHHISTKHDRNGNHHHRILYPGQRYRVFRERFCGRRRVLE